MAHRSSSQLTSAGVFNYTYDEEDNRLVEVAYCATGADAERTPSPFKSCYRSGSLVHWVLK